jgi:hypothetical protein
MKTHSHRQYRDLIEAHAHNLVRQLPREFVLAHMGAPRGHFMQWPCDELSWLASIIHETALGAVDSETGILRDILAWSEQLDAFEPDGLMFDSSATMLRYVALYAYKADLTPIVENMTTAEVRVLLSSTPPADAGKE